MSIRRKCVMIDEDCKERRLTALRTRAWKALENGDRTMFMKCLLECSPGELDDLKNIERTGCALQRLVSNTDLNGCPLMDEKWCDSHWRECACFREFREWRDRSDDQEEVSLWTAGMMMDDEDYADVMKDAEKPAPEEALKRIMLIVNRCGNPGYCEKGFATPIEKVLVAMDMRFDIGNINASIGNPDDNGIEGVIHDYTKERLDYFDKNSLVDPLVNEVGMLDFITHCCRVLHEMVADEAVANEHFNMIERVFGKIKKCIVDDRFYLKFILVDESQNVGNTRIVFKYEYEKMLERVMDLQKIISSYRPRYVRRIDEDSEYMQEPFEDQ